MRMSSKVVAAALAGVVWIAAALTIASQPIAAGAMAPNSAGIGSACTVAVLD